MALVTLAGHTAESASSVALLMIVVMMRRLLLQLQRRHGPTRSRIEPCGCQTACCLLGATKN
jgi:hypothetical protein